MPRFYFHLHNDIECVDEEGVELADLSAARRMAHANAREMAAQNVGEGRLNLGHCIEVTDDSGATLMTVTFREAVEIVG